ncbi:winged helix-turn-helix domain-containing protein [Burkholderia sp. TSV86]|uniref:winged helix-turn-helix domain-containing protein n=1 Tax=Burkholderia sp. TSV86 TaxID=1385594 RepID=UPI000757648A|nr:winged helix-turn-helix domain-containing protein [Burkholderia sp. TSV86]KVE32255.1 hypothetical protein WS68_16520 [Burkholderia sp. TSV86]KVE35251.1 hypothetical protein WS68_07580 [Burkholderia sp. TSV86]
MAEGKMGRTSRLICEYLQSNPGVTVNQMATAMGWQIERARKPVQKLIKCGYVVRGKRRGNCFPLTLTGKSFPSSADWAPNAQYLRRLRRSVIGDAYDVVIPAMRAMIDVGRAAS